MAARFDIYTKAPDRTAAGSLVSCAVADSALTPTSGNSIMRHRGGTAAGETSAPVARCVL
jgi:hypothetical protein